MIKVLIVDDELLMRKGIQSLIHWEDYGCQIIGEKENGEEALDFIRENHVDIVFTDIVMPKLNGLELIEKALSEFPDIKFVVLSCYTDYEYVRKALLFGAKDYILKLSIVPEDLIKIVEKLLHEIFINKKQNSRGSKTETEIQNKFHKLIFDDGSEEEILEKYLESKEYAVYYIRFRPSRHLKLNYARQYLIENVFFNKMEFYAESLDEMVVICQESNDAKKENLIQANSLLSLMGIRFIVGKYEYSQAHINLAKRVKKAKETLKQAFYDGTGFYIYQDKYFSSMYDNSLMRHLMGKICISVRSGDAETSCEILNEFFNKLEEFRLEPSEVRMLLIELTMNYQTILYDMMEIQETPTFKGKIYQEIQAFLTLHEMKSYFKQMSRNIANNISSLILNCGIRGDINRVKAYIDDNLGRFITLKSAAQFVNLSESYLSHIFKEDTGESFSSYLQRKRLEKAKSDLKNSKKTVSDIAVSCGYEDYSYFCRVFKKYTNMSPGEYRKKA